MVTDVEEIKSELSAIRKELHEIKESMPDKDMFLNSEEKRLLEESRINETEGKLKSSKDLRNELGL